MCSSCCSHHFGILFFFYNSKKTTIVERLYFLRVLLLCIAASVKIWRALSNFLLCLSVWVFLIIERRRCFFFFCLFLRPTTSFRKKMCTASYHFKTAETDECTKKTRTDKKTSRIHFIYCGDYCYYYSFSRLASFIKKNRHCVYKRVCVKDHSVGPYPKRWATANRQKEDSRKQQQRQPLGN